MVSNESVIRESALNRVEILQMLQELRSDLMQDVDAKLQRSIDRMVERIQVKHVKQQKILGEKSTPDKVSRRREELPTKEFAIGHSAIAYLWENPNMRSLYNAVFAVFILLYFYIAIFYYFNIERFKNNMAVLFWTFGKFHIVAAIWSCINLSIVFILYPVFRFWATNRIFVKKKGLYDSLFCILFILYEAALIVLPATVIIAYDVPPISSFATAIEQIRLFMKSYAFVRENIPRAIQFKPHQDGSKDDSDPSPCPKVDQLVYFLFAPILIYRDCYPRTSCIRWSHVTWNLLLFFYMTTFYYIPLIWFAVNTFHSTGIEPIPVGDFIILLMQATFPGAILMVGAFYSPLYAIQEAVGEMLRFGDRRFHDDVWKSASFAQFYRPWNVLVHDWLYFYIYRDLYVVWGKRRTCASVTVFILSAAVHEYILAVSCKFLFPLVFVLYMTFGVPLSFMMRKTTSSLGNVFMWFSMLKGYGLLLVCYALEWYARKNCPRTIATWHDYFVPRSFHCDVISWPA